ncbi:MAG: DUF6452 family protein [Bacteroidota bacterium]
MIKIPVFPGFLLSTLLFTFSSCEKCSYSEESSFVTYFNKKVSFSRVEAINGNEKKEIEPYSKSTYILPVPSNSDSVTYIFNRNNQDDTLIIHYVRDFYFQSAKCGYVMELSNATVVKNSGFSNVAIGLKCCSGYHVLQIFL